MRAVLKGHLNQCALRSCTSPKSFAVIQKIRNVLIVFGNRIVSSQPKKMAGCDTLLKRNIDTILFTNTEFTFVLSVLGTDH